MGRPRKPAELKELGGETRPSRTYAEPEIAPATLDESPKQLKGKYARQMWKTIAKHLGPHEVVKDTDLYGLITLANVWQGINEVWDEGEQPHATTLTQFRQMLTEYGMTPASRSKLGPGKTPEKVNPFAKLKVS